MPPVRPQRKVLKPRRFQSSSSESEKNAETKRKRGRPRQTINIYAQKLTKQTDSVKENISVMKRILQLKSSQTYTPIPFCPSNCSSVLPITQETLNGSNTSWEKGITTIAQTSAISSNNITCTISTNDKNRPSFLLMQYSIITTSGHTSSSITNTTSMSNIENHYPSITATSNYFNICFTVIEPDFLPTCASCKHSL